MRICLLVYRRLAPIGITYVRDPNGGLEKTHEDLASSGSEAVRISALQLPFNIVVCAY